MPTNLRPLVPVCLALALVLISPAVGGAGWTPGGCAAPPIGSSPVLIPPSAHLTPFPRRPRCSRRRTRPRPGGPRRPTATACTVPAGRVSCPCLIRSVSPAAGSG